MKSKNWIGKILTTLFSDLEILNTNIIMKQLESPPNSYKNMGQIASISWAKEMIIAVSKMIL